VRSALLAVVAACGASPAKAPGAATTSRFEEVRQAEGRPPVALLSRDGDPSAAVSVAVLTLGVDPAHGAEVPVALAGVVEARLAAAGVRDLRVVPSAEGFRVRALLPSREGARELALALRDALTTPIAEHAPEMDAAQRKLAALARLPVPEPALLAVARCTGEPFPNRAPSAAPTVEAWRVSSLGLGRVVMGAVGPREDVEALASAISRGPSWPTAAPFQPASSPAQTDSVQVYDASPDIPAASARVSLVVETADAERAALAAGRLADPRGPLAQHLAALERLASVRDVTATAHAGWGCLRVTFDLPAPSGSADPPVDVALAIDMAERQMLAELADAQGSVGTAREIANRAGDPRDAAELLAYWALMSFTPRRDEGGANPRVSTVVGLSLPRARSPEDGWAERAGAIRKELDRADRTRKDPVAEVRARVEQGQSGLWLLLGSPCGTESETDVDAGSSAMAALAVAERARREAAPGDVVDAWIAPDGIGLTVHAFPARGESSGALARRVSGIVARSFGTSALDPHDLAGARAALLSRRAAEDVRAFTVLAEALAPGHSSWVFPSGTSEAIERSSDEGVKARLDAIRSGPLRVAFLGPEDASQGDVVVETLGQWLPNRASRRHACPGTPPISARPGTYAIEAAGAPSTTAWLAFALPAADAASLDSATLVAAALGGHGGLLERALGAGLARSWGARVLGPPRVPALVVSVVSAQGSLDAAVGEVRVLFDRLRQEGLRDADRSLAIAAAAAERQESSLDPKARLIALWRGDAAPTAPGADAIHAFTAKTLHDDALIIVAARPPRATLR